MYSPGCPLFLFGTWFTPRAKPRRPSRRTPAPFYSVSETLTSNGHVARAAALRCVARLGMDRSPRAPAGPGALTGDGFTASPAASAAPLKPHPPLLLPPRPDAGGAQLLLGNKGAKVGPNARAAA